MALKANTFEKEQMQWLKHLARGRLTDSQIIRGCIRYYFLEGCQIEDVRGDLLFKLGYRAKDIGPAISHMHAVLRDAAEGRLQMAGEAQHRPEGRE